MERVASFVNLCVMSQETMPISWKYLNLPDHLKWCYLVCFGCQLVAVHLLRYQSHLQNRPQKKYRYPGHFGCQLVVGLALLCLNP